MNVAPSFGSGMFGLLGSLTSNHRQGDPLAHLLDLIVDHGKELGIRGVAAHVLRRSSLVQTATSGLSDEGNEAGRVLPLVAALPATDCVRLGFPVLLGSRAQIDASYPTLSGSSFIVGVTSLATLPVDRNDRTVGSLTFIFERPVEFADDTVTVLAAICRICAGMPEFDHHETRGTDVDPAVGSLAPGGDGQRIAELEERIVRLEQLLAFIAGTTVQHLQH